MDEALASEEARRLLAGASCVRLGPAAEGDAGAGTRELLAKLSGAADTKVPFLVLTNVERKLAAAGLKPEELKPAVLQLLEVLAPLPPEPKKPVALTWGTDYEAARKQSLADGRPLALFFAAAADAAGQKELAEAMAEDGEATELLGRMICVRLDSSGEAGAPHRERLKGISGDKTPPCLAILRFPVDPQKPESFTIAGFFDPVNLPSGKFLPDLRKVLSDVPVPQANAGAGSPKPAEGGVEGKPAEKEDVPPATEKKDESPPAPPPGKKDEPPPEKKG